MSQTAPVETRPFNHAGFNQYVAEGRLMAARCTACGEIFLPPRELCPRCYHTEMEWIELSGAGQLEGFTLIYVGLPAMVTEGYSRKNPYCSGMVRLAEGPAIAAQILAADGSLPADIRVGMPLRARYIERGAPENRRPALVFTPVIPGG